MSSGGPSAQVPEFNPQHLYSSWARARVPTQRTRTASVPSSGFLHAADFIYR